MTEQTPAPAPPEGLATTEWQRLDPRMLLVHPVRESLKFLPVLLGLLIAGSISGGPPWQLLGVLLPIGYGVFRYYTTRYRVADGRIELSRGLLNRRISSTPLDRVRTVDLTASLIHRVLGLTTLRIGTGVATHSDSDSLDLDGLSVERARELRTKLLQLAPRVRASTEQVEQREQGETEEPVGQREPVRQGAAPDQAEDQVLARFDPRWLRFAPFTATGAIVVAASLGALSQAVDNLGLWDRLDSVAVALPSAIGIAVVVAVVIVVLLVVSVLGYLVTNGGYLLTRSAGAWHVRRGLLTTRETSIDEARLAGVALGEPLALRLVGARHLQAIVTGVDRSTRDSSTLVPPSDADVSPRVAVTMLGSRPPVQAPLETHGPAAARRRWTRSLLCVVPLVAGAVVATILGWWWTLLPAALVVAIAAGLAADRVSGLGHGLADGYLIARSGSLARRRQMLATEHVIGWNLRASWFQRRVGLTTMAATTAAGDGSITVLDIPDADAVALAGAALPGLVSQFCEPGAPQR
ncbi:PH domain-containing protein [Nocardioides sp. GXZ039]|uniref:PH domain-containing protein n=1 Tax=Nocardioides sp. GXZ039 TaxID=3136018 RepID=UPI0030F3E21D